MHKHLPYILTILLITSCGPKGNRERVDKPGQKAKASSVHSKATSVHSKESKVANALKFINSYVQNCSKTEKQLEMTDWVATSKMTTVHFNEKMQEIIDEAYKEDPELGLDFDPIFDAQDYPDEGFELESLDEKTNYLIVRGKKWKEFKLTMKMRLQNGKWLVDGCGFVNIPPNNRANK